MKTLLALLTLALPLGIAIFLPEHGPAAVLVAAAAGATAAFVIYRIEGEREFLLQIFIAALLLRMLAGTLIFGAGLQEFFGGDANTYDQLGHLQLQIWGGDAANQHVIDAFGTGGGWGMLYVVAAIYAVVGRNMLAVQFFNSVLGAATAPLVFLCARHIFQNLRVARLSAFAVAFYPSLVLWSCQGLKDGPIIFCLALAMYATLRLGERMSARHFAMLVGTLFAILSLRFYIFYMLVSAVVGSFVIGMRQVALVGFARQLVVVAGLGLAMTYLGVLSTAQKQAEAYGNLERVQVSRADLVRSADSGFLEDADVSSTTGVVRVVPLGMIYLLFAPFPWQLANLRQSITLPEMLIWWASFPLLVLGLWFTARYRLRQAMPILTFTTMMTIGYSVFQGNVGTAYRQRAQILIFYFIFVAVGYVLLRERQEDRARIAEAARRRAEEAACATRGGAGRGREPARRPREKELTRAARGLGEELDV
ncbi:MAG: glycosyltransferase family 39 protein [Acidobacteria bacterium]|nr:glycosyltransferase family 39 protein [Acidobacteriota bacterium]